MKQRIRYHIYLLVLLCFSLMVHLEAQDPRFSQFNQNTLHLNPATTGLYDGGLRASVSYRSQFYSALSEQEYISYSASLENKWNVGKSFFAGGAFLLNDKVGASDYQRTYYNLSGAYHQIIAEGSPVKPYMFLVFGAQAGRGQYAFDARTLWFSNQFDNDLLEVDFNRASGEPFLDGTNTSFTDLNAGIVFYLAQQNGNTSSNAYSFYIGGAMHHITQPAVGLLEASDEFLNRRITVHGGGEIQTGNFTIMPAAVVRKQGPAISALAGSAVRVDVGSVKEEVLQLRAGAWLHVARRFSDQVLPESVIVTSVFEYDGVQLGFSYDITVNTQKQFNFSRGAFEVSLVWVGAQKYRSKVRCPKL